MTNIKFLCTSLFVLAVLASGILQSAAGTTQHMVLQLAALLD